MRKLLYISLFLGLTMFLKAGKDKQRMKAYEALLVYDYFKARQMFYDINKKDIDFAAAYGLATIYHRMDNPFSNNDSAVKFIHLSYQMFLSNSQAYIYKNFRVDKQSILALADTICQKQYKTMLQKGGVEAMESFLRNNTLANPNLRHKVIYERDELVFANVIKVNKSDSTKAFMQCYPMSDFYLDAGILLQRQIFAESTFDQKPEAYINFLKKYPNNIMVNEAYEKLFDYYRKRQSINGLNLFVKNYPKSPQWLEAWKLMFALSVKAYSSDELQHFLNEHPEFPLKNSILKELELNKWQLYPVQKDDYVGYINEEAAFVISPQFDQANDFFEGLAVVTKNDSVYFINKENDNPFKQIYQDAYSFRNGLAAVKQQNKWFFINRQGQVVSRYYEEINDMSNNLYVFKLNGKYGACNHFGQTIIDAKFDKLGDFKNNMAYFISDGKYGFVNIKGLVYNEQFDWISDFDEKGIAIYKRDNKFGLVNAQGEKLGDNMFDQMIRLNNNFYMVINQNMYGFYSSDACFVVPILYDYNKEKGIDFYYKDQRFKCLKNGEQAIIDENGHFDIAFGAFKEIDFMSNGLMLARKKIKYGYVDKKQSAIIPFKFIEAGNFVDSVAIVKVKKEYCLIDNLGKTLYISEKPIKRYNALYYMVEDENKTLINRRGEVVLKDIVSLQQINNSLLLVTFSNGQQQIIK